MKNNYDKFLKNKIKTFPASGFEPGVLSDSLFPFQRDIVGWALRRGKAALFADTGLGKALAAGEPVLTPSGWRAIGELAVGDVVVGSNGEPCRVKGVFPQGIRSLFRVTFNDGAHVDCDAEHLWSVNTKHRRCAGKPYLVKTLTAIMSEGLNDQSGKRHFTPVMSVARFEPKELPLDPYTLGVLLGDGGLTRGTPQLTTDHEIVSRLVLPNGIRAELNGEISPGVGSYSLRGLGAKHHNELTTILDAIGVNGKYSYEKSVPTEFLWSSVAQRLELLRGLLDTDAYIGTEDGHVEFTSSSKQLADDVVFLVRSLGGTTRESTKDEPFYVKDGERVICRPAYRVCVQMPGEVKPMHLARKLANWRPRLKYKPSRAIANVEHIGEGHAVCIAVDSADQLFVTRDFVVTHNTRMQIEWCRRVVEQSGSRALILAPLAVAAQTVREGAQLGITVTHCREPEDVRDGINVTNYDRVHKFDTEMFGAVVLDEGSIIKNYTSKTLTQLMVAFANTPYRLIATATPSPNDYTELGNHAEFLGVCTRTEMLAEYFVHDSGDTQTWRLKGHARSEFWKWVASWAALVRRPSDLGYEDTGYILPSLRVHEHTVQSSDDTLKAMGVLFASEAGSLVERRGARKASVGGRVEQCTAAVLAEPDEAWVVWCELNAEGEALRKSIPGSVEIAGADDSDVKEKRLTDFAEGRTRVLISKPSISGFGLNWQHAARMAFVGVTDSFESYYQAVRREWRFGQKREVHVHIFASDAEGAVVANLKRKERDAARMADELSIETRDAVRNAVRGNTKTVNAYTAATLMSRPSWLKTTAGE